MRVWLNQPLQAFDRSQTQLHHPPLKTLSGIGRGSTTAVKHESGNNRQFVSVTFKKMEVGGGRILPVLWSCEYFS